MKFPPTEEQQAVIDAASSTPQSIMVKAYAGCTKTTTIEMAFEHIKEQNWLSLAFNVKTKKESEARLPKYGTVKTQNGLGHSAWGKAIGKRLTLDEKKISKLITQTSKENKFDLTSSQWSMVLSLVLAARGAGLVPDKWPQQGLLSDTEESWRDLCFDCLADEDLWPVAREVLNQSIRLSFQGVIDFDDQIYQSVLFNGVFAKYPLVVVDEFQDLNPMNILQVKKSASDRIIVVGDPLQAIYGFRGADAEAEHKFKALRPEGAWTHLPLTTTFRCPKIITQKQSTHAKGFNSWTGCKQGVITNFSDRWTWKNVEALAKPGDQITILCRNNAPLLSMALKLVKKKIGCSILGGNLGKSLVTLAKKILKKDSLSIEHCITMIEHWREEQVRKAQAADRDDKVAAIHDRADCLLAVAEDGDCKDASSLISTLESIFNQGGLITLSTIHKFKGLESEVVLHLDPHRLPSKWAQKALAEGKPLQMVQEMNLLYVCETRTKNILINAKLEDFI